MTNPIILNGKTLSNKIKDDLYDKISLLEKKPGLGIILVGSRPDSEVYVRMKKNACKKLGIVNYDVHLDENVTEATIVKEIMNVMPRHSQEGLAVFQKIRNERVTKSADANKATEQKKVFQKENVPDLSRTKSDVVKKKETFKPGETFPLGNVPILVVGFKQKEKANKLGLVFSLIDGRNVSWNVSTQPTRR